MAHPHNEHRDHKVQHRRVHHITHGMAEGGYDHSMHGTEMKPIRHKASKVVHRAAGGRVKVRADRPRRAHGGGVSAREPERFVKEQKHLKHPTHKPYEGAPDDMKSMHGRVVGERRSTKATLP